MQLYSSYIVGYNALFCLQNNMNNKINSADKMHAQPLLISVDYRFLRCLTPRKLLRLEPLHLEPTVVYSVKFSGSPGWLASNTLTVLMASAPVNDKPVARPLFFTRRLIIMALILKCVLQKQRSGHSGLAVRQANCILLHGLAWPYHIFSRAVTLARIGAPSKKGV